MEDFENYEVASIIGSGSFGTCYKVKHKTSFQEFVWKAINYGQMTEEKKQSVVSEVNVLSKLRHPNIVRYYDHIIHKNSSTLYIIMEYCSGGDLSKVIKQCLEMSQYLNEIFIWRILYQIASALNVCHSQCTATVLHRDIKPANVFLDGENNVKLGDFGLAKILKEKENYTDTFVGTPVYMSPEQIRNKKYNKKSDVWALGCLIYEVCALKPPFIGHSFKNLQNKIKEGTFNRIPEYYSNDLHEMVVYMLSTDCECRPTVDIVVRHPSVVLKSCKSVESIFQQLPTTNGVECNSHKTKKNLEIRFDQNSQERLKNIQNNVAVMNIKDEKQNLTEKFSENLQIRLENVRNREAAIKKQEEKLYEKERLIHKKEKKLALMERLVNDKISQANLYLKRSKENKTGNKRVLKLKQCDADLDTSFSADPGDTSILPTSMKIDEQQVTKPKNFIRSKSNRKVHFTSQKIFQTSSDDVVFKEYNFFTGESLKLNNDNKNKPVNNFTRIFKSLNNKTSISSNSTLSNVSSSNSARPMSWTEENKKCAFSLLKLMNIECEKENIHSKITHTKL